MSQGVDCPLQLFTGITVGSSTLSVLFPVLPVPCLGFFSPSFNTYLTGYSQRGLGDAEIKLVSSVWFMTGCFQSPRSQFSPDAHVLLTGMGRPDAHRHLKPLYCNK